MNKTSAVLTVVIIGLLIFPACRKKADTPLTDFGGGNSKDLTLAGDIEVPGSTQRVVMKIKGEKTRTDIEALGISIVAEASGERYVLNHTTKTIEKQAVPAIQAMNQADAAKLAKAFVMQFTGRTDTISGWKTREFLICDLHDKDVPAAEQGRLVAWIAEEFPDGRDIQQLVERSMPNQAVASLRKAIGKEFTMPGFALRTESTEGGRTTFKITYTAIKQGELQESDFELPQDYMRSLSK